MLERELQDASPEIQPSRAGAGLNEGFESQAGIQISAFAKEILSFSVIVTFPDISYGFVGFLLQNTKTNTINGSKVSR